MPVKERPKQQLTDNQRRGLRELCGRYGDLCALYASTLDSDPDLRAIGREIDERSGQLGDCREGTPRAVRLLGEIMGLEENRTTMREKREEDFRSHLVGTVNFVDDLEMRRGVEKAVIQRAIRSNNNSTLPPAVMKLLL